MSYSLYPEREHESPFGPIRIAVTSGDHIHLSTDSDKCITVNTVAYTLSVHLKLTPGGWTIQADAPIYMSKVHAKNYRDTAPSRAAVAKVRAWIAEKFIPVIPDLLADLLPRAEQSCIEREIESLDSNIAELEKQLRELKASRAHAAEKLKALQSRIRQTAQEQRANDAGSVPAIPHGIPPERIHLQAVGNVPAVKASELQVGDVLRWNFGYTSTIERITPNQTGSMITVEFVGSKYPRRYRLDTLVARVKSKE